MDLNEMIWMCRETLLLDVFQDVNILIMPVTRKCLHLNAYLKTTSMSVVKSEQITDFNCSEIAGSLITCCIKHSPWQFAVDK